MNEELLYRIALTMIPELGPVRIKSLIDQLGNATAVFKPKRKELAAIEAMSDALSRAIKNWHQFNMAEAEMRFIEQHHIQPLFITDAAYPQRLLHCYDPPSLLFYKGTANLNHTKMISIIGTRQHTAYGRQVTEDLIKELSNENLIIVSGLAFGIDAIAHKTALQLQIPTVGVLAHGLDSIYPSQHRTLAKEMLLNGGLLTEYCNGTLPDRHNFPKRNRIVAGMTDATIVIETAIKGGSMITAELAVNYHRDLFAVPGKITDAHSQGCLRLIQQNKAILFSSALHMIETMGWINPKKKPTPQKELFIDLTKEEARIVQLLTENNSLPVDELYIKSGFSSSQMAAIILQLELKNVIRALPGKMFVLT